MKATSAAFTSVFQSSPADWTRERLEPLSARELELCSRLMGLPHSGTKDQVIARLLTAARVRTVLSPYSADHAGASEMAAQFKRPELVALARSVGAFYSVPKVGIAVSLINWRQACRRTGLAFLKEWQEQSKSVPRQMRLKFD